MNNRLLVTADNLNSLYYIQLAPFPNTVTCNISSESPDGWTTGVWNSSCDFIYSLVVPKYHPSNDVPYFVYNCIDQFGNNMIGLYADISNNNTCIFKLKNNAVVPGNYSTQNNFILCMEPNGSGVYGFADDFIFYYNLSSFQLSVLNFTTFGLSPRACDMIMSGSSTFALVAGYVQTYDWSAEEMVFLFSLNPPLVDLPKLIDVFNIPRVLHFPFGDPRRNRLVAQSRDYVPQNSLSVSIASRTGQILIGIQSLNTVLLLILDNATNPTGFLNNSSSIHSKQNGVVMGYGKSVAWLDNEGQTAAILANTYAYFAYEWISSSIHVYEIDVDSFNDSLEPLTIYPNSEQVLQPQLSPSFIYFVSSSGHVALLDNLGTPFVLLSAPFGAYPTTSTSGSFSVKAPCIRGTYNNHYGIELCTPCSNGTYSSRGAINCSACDSNVSSFCPFGAVAQLFYADLKSIVPQQDYPESPELTIFSDILLQNMFTLNHESNHCRIVSPLTWVIFVVGLVVIILIIMGISAFYPRSHLHRNRVKVIFKHIDLIGEGELWIGGLVSIAIIILLTFAYLFSHAYYYRYPIEQVGSNPWFGCQNDMRNSKFSSSMQMMGLQRITKENDDIFDMLDRQPFTLNIDFINTAFTCNDSIVVQRLFAYTLMSLPITSCYSTKNESIISLVIPLPSHEIYLQLILPGVRTVGAIRLGLTGPGNTSDDERSTLRELNFASLYEPLLNNQVLAPSINFLIRMTRIVNQTTPLIASDPIIFGAMWSYAFDTKADELFITETQYTFYKRQKTLINITLSNTAYFISNLQEPIVKYNDLIFHNLLFTIVVLELFGLLLLVFKILIVPVFRISIARISKQTHRDRSDTDQLTSVAVTGGQGAVIHRKTRPSNDDAEQPSRATIRHHNF
ncbi:unnamed protein product [Didymodactylos carnosus]|uniref:Tyrosine-protein kinase ephrin type A/B receptor-like domain-containing protein n=1 Tax=Didymodactylos carnosus TaxID=1234261 RepID=A0A815EAW8_9BILA|nr:unnamed protein product [Didymodactylos carnosus]CAF4146513.1 unnamed protein product [Didymodactylos carnosus]